MSWSFYGFDLGGPDETIITTRSPVTKSPNMPSRIELRRWAIEQAIRGGSSPTSPSFNADVSRILTFVQPDEKPPAPRPGIYNGEPAWTPPPGGAAQASPFPPPPDTAVNGKPPVGVPEPAAGPTNQAAPRSFSFVTQQIAEELDKTFYGRLHSRALTEEIVDFVRSRIGKRNAELEKTIQNQEAEYSALANDCAELRKQLITLRRDIVELTKAKGTAERYFDKESKNASIHYARVVELERRVADLTAEADAAGRVIRPLREERNAAEMMIVEMHNAARHAREHAFDAPSALRVMERALEIFKDKVAARSNVAQASAANTRGDSDHANPATDTASGRDPHSLPR